MTETQRTVTIYKPEGFDKKMQDYHGHTVFQNALGYLSDWNMWENRYDTVTIRCALGGPKHGGDEMPSILAVYSKKQPSNSEYPTPRTMDQQFVICAIFHPQQSATDEHNGRLASFSFHS